MYPTKNAGMIDRDRAKQIGGVGSARSCLHWPHWRGPACGQCAGAAGPWASPSPSPDPGAGSSGWAWGWAVRGYPELRITSALLGHSQCSSHFFNGADIVGRWSEGGWDGEGRQGQGGETGPRKTATAMCSALPGRVASVVTLPSTFREASRVSASEATLLCSSSRSVLGGRDTRLDSGILCSSVK